MTRSFTGRRRAVLALGALAAWAAVPRLGRAATFPFIPEQYTFSLAQIQQAVARKFPYQRQVAQVFTMTLQNPQLTLLPDMNRVAIAADARIDSPFLAQTALGQLALDTALAYDRERLAVVLRAPHVEKADFGAAAGEYSQQVNDAAALVATQFLDGYPIFTFKPEQLSFAGVHYEPDTITVLPRGIRVHIIER